MSFIPSNKGTFKRHDGPPIMFIVLRIIISLYALTRGQKNWQRFGADAYLHIFAHQPEFRDSNEQLSQWSSYYMLEVTGKCIVKYKKLEHNCNVFGSHVYVSRSDNYRLQNGFSILLPATDSFSGTDSFVDVVVEIHIILLQPWQRQLPKLRLCVQAFLNAISILIF